MNKKIAHVVLALPVEGPFDYSIPEELQGKVSLGARVLILFSGKKCVGYIVGLVNRSSILKLNPVLELLDEEPVFSEAFLKFSTQFALYFGCSQGEALELFLPAYLRKPRIFEYERKGEMSIEVKDQGLSLGHSASRTSFSRQLIFDHGLTKQWDLLLPRIQETLVKGRGVVCLIPDGSFAGNVLPKLSTLVSPEQFVVIHKGTEKEEFGRWLKIRNGTARLVVGCISAVFSPVQNLGLVVILDEENHFYKHDQSPFYHAREAAFLRQPCEGADVICVSSAPSVEVWHAVAEKKDQLCVLEDVLPAVKLLDLTNFKMKKETAISSGLAQHMEKTLQAHKTVFLYVPAARGTSDVVREAAQRFPGVDVASYEKTASGVPTTCDILVATQAVFRHRASLRFHLSAIVDIDWEFHKNDYRAAHGAFALVQHVRQMTTGLVLLQTRNIHNGHLHMFAANDYEKFYRQELHHRRDMGLPPYNVLVALVLRSEDPALACVEAKKLYDVLNEKRHETIGVLEPQQDRSAIVRGKFRYCVMVHGLEIKEIAGFVKEALRSFRRKKDVVITINVNP
ncbi:MAG: hypothetical protein HQL21_07700 [Candidatus Omnitrophica bacterium]|nr:hypothetical protein [Candidatus Omnitrophota bacterium]